MSHRSTKSNKSSKDAIYRTVFDQLIHDMITLLFSPDWPVAEFLLGLCCKTMVSVLAVHIMHEPWLMMILGRCQTDGYTRRKEGISRCECTQGVVHRSHWSHHRTSLPSASKCLRVPRWWAEFGKPRIVQCKPGHIVIHLLDYVVHLADGWVSRFSRPCSKLGTPPVYHFFFKTREKFWRHKHLINQTIS